MSGCSVPYHRPSIGREEINEVVDTLNSGWLTTGQKTAQFEREFGQYVGAPHSMGVNSCTAALHVALSALGLGPGDEVITTPLTFCATVNTILHTGAKCVLADVGDDGNLSPARVKDAITSRTKAILPVHFAGQSCDMQPIWDLAREHGLRVVEDAAHAVGTTYLGTPAGGKTPGQDCSDAVAFSFYATKNLTTGEGGMVTTHDEHLAAKMRLLCLHGISKDAWNRYGKGGSWKYQVAEVGFKYNIPDILSAIGIHQLRRQEEFIARRTWIASRYCDAFSGREELLPPPLSSPLGRHSWHLYVLRLNLPLLSIGRDEFIDALAAAGVQCSVHFIPIPMHQAYQNHPGVAEASVSHALRLYSNSLSLPLYPGMSDEQVEFVIQTVLSTVSQTRRKQLVATPVAN